MFSILQHAQDVLNYIDAVIWSYDTKSRQFTWSDGFEKILGLSLEETSRYETLVHPDDIPAVLKHIELLVSGMPSTIEYRIFRPNGELRWLRCIGSPPPLSGPISGKAHGLIIDITSHRTELNALKNNLTVLQTALNTIDVAIWSYEFASRKAQYASEAITQITGYPSRKLIAPAAWMNIMHPDDLYILETISAAIDKGDSSISECRIYHADGALRWVEVRSFPTRSDTGAIDRVHGVVIDITSRKTKEDPLQQSEQRDRSGEERNRRSVEFTPLPRDISEGKRTEQIEEEAARVVRVSEDRYFRLQTSLDQFSRDLVGVMKVSEMEQRLVNIVREVIKTTKVSLIEMDRCGRAVVKCGDPDIPESLLHHIMNGKHIVVGDLLATEEGCLLKVDEDLGNSRYLYIVKKQPTPEIKHEIVWLKTIARYVSVHYDNFQLTDNLTKRIEQMATERIAPSWLLRLLFNLSENERKRLAQDLHDAALQEQSVWYRKLELLSTDRFVPEYIREQLQPIAQGMLDVIYYIRNICNELRPPTLLEEGLVSSLQALFELTQMRTNFSIHFVAPGFNHELPDDVLIGLYRVVQELLANAAKHSNATLVTIGLSDFAEGVRLNYEDNGVGMDLARMENSFNRMGIYGIKERVRSMDGKVEFHSSPNRGLKVIISIPSADSSAKRKGMDA